MRVVSKKFYMQNTVDVAKGLLGKYLVHNSRNGTTGGKIVETEAYTENDPACHAFKGMTKRNEAMFLEGGCAYVYFIYGMYFCFNVVTREKGVGEAVLIRALEPVTGLNLMKKRRRVQDKFQLCNGPGKLVIAMGLSKEHNRASLATGKVRILEGRKPQENTIMQTTRVGIAKGKDSLYRFYLKDNRYVSRL